MDRNFKFHKDQTALLIVDVQDKLIALEDRSAEVLGAIQKVIKGFQILSLPIVVTEQYPEGLGQTVSGIKSLLGPNQTYLTKTAFSCLGDFNINSALQAMEIKQWILVGIEAHVCILQTAKDLIASGKQVAVLNDAITSRSIYDFSTAIAEMRDIGVRISSVETILFELLQDSLSPEFKKISQLLK
ncbi:MAG: isochorismatase family protein [Parachlamydiaceae bacterium]|nr:isochorismatase family protein [Parachlamydiaceae bacterium]